VTTSNNGINDPSSHRRPHSSTISSDPIPSIWQPRITPPRQVSTPLNDRISNQINPINSAAINHGLNLRCWLPLLRSGNAASSAKIIQKSNHRR